MPSCNVHTCSVQYISQLWSIQPVRGTIACMPIILLTFVSTRQPQLAILRQVGYVNPALHHKICDCIKHPIQHSQAMLAALFAPTSA